MHVLPLSLLVYQIGSWMFELDFHRRVSFKAAWDTEAWASYQCPAFQGIHKMAEYFVLLSHSLYLNEDMES